MEDEGEKHLKKHDQENIMLKKQIKISPTNDEEMRHARSSSDDDNSIDE